MVFDDAFNAQLLQQAKESSRLRAHQNLHQSYQEPVQRLYIGLLKGSYIPPHCHKHSHQWEFFQVISGVIKLIVFDAKGVVTDIYHLGEEQGRHAVQLPPETIHTLVPLSDEAILFELKQGPFNANEAKDVPAWSIGENDCVGPEMAMRLENIQLGQPFRT